MRAFKGKSIIVSFPQTIETLKIGDIWPQLIHALVSGNGKHLKTFHFWIDHHYYRNANEITESIELICDNMIQMEDLDFAINLKKNLFSLSSDAFQSFGTLSRLKHLKIGITCNTCVVSHNSIMAFMSGFPLSEMMCFYLYNTDKSFVNELKCTSLSQIDCPCPNIKFVSFEMNYAHITRELFSSICRLSCLNTKNTHQW